MRHDEGAHDTKFRSVQREYMGWLLKFDNPEFEKLFLDNYVRHTKGQVGIVTVRPIFLSNIELTIYFFANFSY